MSLRRGRDLPIGARAGLLDPKHVKAIGSARWLYDWILWRVTLEQDGVGLVLGGSPVRCEEIAADLGVGLRTVYRWMGRLRGAYIRTRHVVTYGRHGLAIEVLRSKKFHAGTDGSRGTLNSRSLAPIRKERGWARDDSVRRDAAEKNAGEILPAFAKAAAGRRFAQNDNPSNRRGGVARVSSHIPRGISTISANSTANPARCGSGDSAGIGRVNPARNGGFPKEERKPFSERYEKGNFDFLEDLQGQARFCKANPFPPGLEEQNQEQNQEQDEKQIPRRSPLRPPRDDRPWTPGAGKAGDGEMTPACGKNAGEAPALPAERRAGTSPAPTDGVGRDARAELRQELRRMIRAKALPGEPSASRRELLERQKCALLKLAERRCLPP